MKKIILLGVFAIVANSSFAQLFTSLGFNLNTSTSKSTTYSTTTDGDKSLNFMIAPRIGGFFYKQRMVAGIDLLYSSSRTILAGSTNKESSRQYGAGSFIRYIHKFNEYIGIWGEFQASVAFEKAKYNDIEKTKTSLVNAHLIPGFILFAGKHLSFEFSYGAFGHTYSRVLDLLSSTKSFVDNNDFGISLSPGTPRFAVNYTF